jgi:hypothetical protein
MSRSLQRPTQAEHRRRACPPPKTTHGVLTTRTAVHDCPFPQLTSFRPSLHTTQLTTVLRLAHGMRRTNPAPPLPLTLFTLCLAVPSTLRPSQRRWKPDANPTLPHRLSCLDRPTVQQRKKAGQLTQFSLTRSSTNYKRSALVTVLCQSRSGSQTVTAIQACDTGQRIKEDLEAKSYS